MSVGRGPRCIAVALALAWATSAAPRGARAEGRPSYGGVAVGSVRSEPVVLEPPAARTQSELALVSAVCDPLYRIDPDAGVVPHLAASLPVATPEPHTVRISLRPGVQFHDGAPVYAADVASALARARDAGPLANVVQAVAALANDELLVTLVRPWASSRDEVVRALSSPLAAIWKPANEPLVCTGAFVVTRVDRPGRRMTLTANEIHFAGRPYLDRVELRWYEQSSAEARAYEAGISHVSLRGAVAFTGHRPKYPTDELTGPASLLSFVGFGRGHSGALRATAFGRALSLAIDRASFRFVGLGGPVTPAVEPLLPDLGGRAASAREQQARRSAATRQLRVAVASNPALAAVASGEAVVSLLVDRTRPDDIEVAQKIVSGLDKIGVRARIDPVPSGEFHRRVAEGRSDLYVGELAVVARSRAVAERVVRGIERRDGAAPVALFFRGLRVHHQRRLLGLRFDALGALRLADAYFVEP